MNRKSLMVFHALMKKGWIERQADHEVWEYSMDPDIIDELVIFQEELGFELQRIRDRLYMIPTQDNDLFLKNNEDFRKDVGGNEVRNRDIYLMNFMAVYLLYLFFNSEVSGNQIRTLISIEDYISELNNYFSRYEKSDESIEDMHDYSESFQLLCNDWLTKIEGDLDNRKITTKFGIVNKLMVKLKADDVFSIDDNGIIKPTQKCKDLMPYFLKKDRIIKINNILKEEEIRATDK